MKYPEYAQIGDEKYKINTDFRYALRCFKEINNKSINDIERAYAVIYILFGIVPDKNLDLFLEKAKIFLQCGKTDAQQNTNEADMDFNYDYKYITASFLSDYKIDTDNQKIHWWKFIDLIDGLTKNCILNRIREIRTYDLSEVKDAKTRQKIVDMQKAVALPVMRTKEEQDAIDEFESLFE